MEISDGKKLKGQGDINTRYKISTWHKSSVISKTATAGITMIALVLTIIVLLILAGVTIATLTGDNGILNQANNAKQQTEISDEKEVIEVAAVQAMGKNKYGELEKDEFQKALNNQTGRRKTEVTDCGENFEVYFEESKRYYEVDKDGNVGNYQIAVETSNAGDITRGGTLDGSEERPYEISCIEDLVAFSIMSKGGNNELGLGKSDFAGKSVILTRTLNFNSNFSYYDYETTLYGDLNSDGQVEGIKLELTKKEENCIGFNPVVDFKGDFNGKGYEIKNIYINSTKDRCGLFSRIVGATVQNLKISGNVKQLHPLATNGTSNCSCGGIAGYGDSKSTIKNCINNATIESISYAGGIAGNFNGKIEGCFNERDIISKGTTGGIKGTGNATILNCYNIGNITVTGGYSAAGIEGGDYWSGSSKIYNCYNQGNIKCEANSIYACPGGIFGYMQNNISSLNIVNCYNVGETTAKSWNKGSIIGWIRMITPTTKNCYYLTGLKPTSIATPYSQEYMQSQDFVNELNNYITSNNDDIDTTGLAKWITKTDGYPTLDFNTIWDGKEWIHKE